VTCGVSEVTTLVGSEALAPAMATPSASNCDVAVQCSDAAAEPSPPNLPIEPERSLLPSPRMYKLGICTRSECATQTSPPPPPPMAPIPGSGTFVPMVHSPGALDDAFTLTQHQQSSAESSIPVADASKCSPLQEPSRQSHPVPVADASKCSPLQEPSRQSHPVPGDCLKACGSPTRVDEVSTKAEPTSNGSRMASEQMSVSTVSSDLVAQDSPGARLKAPSGPEGDLLILPAEDPPEYNSEHSHHSNGLVLKAWTAAGRPPSSSGSVGGSSAGTGSLMRMADALEALAMANNWNLSAPGGERGVGGVRMMRGSGASQGGSRAEYGEPPRAVSMAASVSSRAPSTTRSGNERVDSVGALPHEDSLLVDILMQV
jgi:hypothetical protein